MEDMNEIHVLDDVGFNCGTWPQVPMDSNKNLKYDDIKKNKVKNPHKVSFNQISGNHYMENTHESELSEVVSEF